MNLVNVKKVTMSNIKQLNKDFLEILFAPLMFGGVFIVTIYLMLCDYLSIDIERGGITKLQPQSIFLLRRIDKIPFR